MIEEILRCFDYNQSSQVTTKSIRNFSDVSDKLYQERKEAEGSNMASKGIYSASKSISDPIGFSKATSGKVIISSKNALQGYIQSFDSMKNSFPKSVTKVFLCRSPLQGQKEQPILNALAIALFGSEMMHFQIIIEVDYEIYYTISYSQDGLQIIKGLDVQSLLGFRPDNKIYKEKKGSGNVKRVVETIQKTKHQKDNYDPILWNCQHFSWKIWSIFN